MTKKCFAAIKSAQETMKDILNTAWDALARPDHEDAALNDILAKAEKWNADFGDVDPAWQPPEPEKEPHEDPMAEAKKLGAFIQE